MMNQNWKRRGSFVFLLLLSMGSLMGCSGGTEAANTEKKEKIIFADVGWDSIKLHNAVAGLIAETAFDLAWEEISGTTPIIQEALKKGDVDVHMEIWTSNLPDYEKDRDAGAFLELGLNFGDNAQGLYVPRYVIEGDAARGIEASAPDLKTVADLKKYKEVFVDEEDKDKGRIYGAISGWEVDQIMFKKVAYYGLDTIYNYFRPGSQAAMDGVLSAAYEKGEPVVGYYWEPTWLMGKYDFVLLEDAPYDPATYPQGATECPSVPVVIGCSTSFAKTQPAYTEFLKKYQTSSKLTAEGLAYMQTTGSNYQETAKWFLQEHDELLEQWLTSDQAQKVRTALSK